LSDYAIRAQFETPSPPEAVRRWLDNSSGIAGWWSDTVEGSSAAVGDTFSVTFPTSPVVFELEVTALSDEVVEWYVETNPPWWQGTKIRFDLSRTDAGETRLVFTHSGFDPADPIIQVITPAWVRFLDNLVAVAESGEPKPAVVN
jgi:Activator of Hsp90 ATPase homolog 1-like protein